MIVDPRISFWLNVVLTILIGISTGAVSLTGVADAVVAKSVIAWCGLGAFVLGAINTALFGISNTVAGRISAAKALDEVKKIEIKPTATGVARDMAHDPTEPKIGIAQQPPQGPVTISPSHPGG